MTACVLPPLSCLRRRSSGRPSSEADKPPNNYVAEFVFVSVLFLLLCLAGRTGLTHSLHMLPSLAKVAFYKSKRGPLTKSRTTWFWTPNSTMTTKSRDTSPVLTLNQPDTPTCITWSQYKEGPKSQPAEPLAASSPTCFSSVFSLCIVRCHFSTGLSFPFFQASVLLKPNYNVK